MSKSFYEKNKPFYFFQSESEHVITNNFHYQDKSRKNFMLTEIRDLLHVYLNEF